MSIADYTIYADGSANNSGGGGGSACIVVDNTDLSKTYLTAFMLHATSNQAEIFATLLGYAYISLLQAIDQPTVEVVSDSEYVLNSSAKWVYKWDALGILESKKNAHYWNMYLDLTRDMQIITKHVKGHSGQLENEECDKAANWARTQVRDSMDKGYIEVPKKKRNKIISSKIWYHITGTTITEALNIGYNKETLNSLQELLLPLIDYKTPCKFDSLEDNILTKMLEKVTEAVHISKAYCSNGPKVSTLVNELNTILQRFDYRV